MNENQINISSQETHRRQIEQAFNPDCCKIIRKNLFSNLGDPAVTITDGYISFNSACINNLEGTDYIMLLYDENQRYLSVTECEDTNKHALRWCATYDNKRRSRKMRCPDFSKQLFRQLEWNSNNRYKVIGYKIERENRSYFVFDLNTPQINARILK